MKVDQTHNENQIFPLANSIRVIQTADYELHMASIFHYIFGEFLRHGNEAFPMCHEPAREIVDLLAKIVEQSYAASFDDREYDTAERVRKYIDEHYADDCALDTMARSLRMSISHLTHSFKIYAGMPPGKYVVNRKIGEAQTLLTRSEYSISRIAGMVGFDNPDYFATSFSKVVHMPPSQYRLFWKNSG